MITSLQKFSHIVDWPSFMAARVGDMQDLRLRKFFQAGVCDPDTTVGRVSFVALDFETTGLNYDCDDIVSIGLIPFTLSGISCSGAEYWILKPRQSLENSVVIHGITHSDVCKAPDLTKIFEDLLEVLAGKVVVAHCLDIERNFLHSALVKRLGEGVCFPMVDTMAIEAEKQIKKNGFLQKMFRRRYPSIRLADARQRYGLPIYQSHHALTDALATAELFLAQLAHHYSPDLPVQNLWR